MESPILRFEWRWSRSHLGSIAKIIENLTQNLDFEPSMSQFVLKLGSLLQELQLLSLGRKFRFTSKIPLPMIIEVVLKDVSVARNTSVASYVHNWYYILCEKYVGSISIEIEDMDARVLFIRSSCALIDKYAILCFPYVVVGVDW